MVPETSTPGPEETLTDESRSSTLINAVIGAIVGIVLSFIPLSTVLGGAVAGYLEEGDTGDGLRVGGIAGVIMLVPLVFVGFLMMMFMTGFALGRPPIRFGIMMFFMLVFVALYTVGLSIVGGFLGVYLKDEM